MKIRLFLIISMMLIFTFTNAETTKKDLKKDLKSKVEKSCRKTAKELKKTGWMVMPGKLPMDRQIQDSRYAELEQLPDGTKAYMVGTHQATGGNYSAAKQIADSRARAELAQQVSTTVAQNIKDQVSNLNLGDGDIEVIDETIAASKSIILAQLKGITPTLEIYRELDKSQFEVKVVLTISYQKALKDAKMSITSELKKKSEQLAKDIDAALTK